MYGEQTSQNRRKSGEWFRALVDAMGEGLGILDENDVLTYANPALCEMLGYSPEELIGQPVAEAALFDETSRPVLHHHLKAHRQGDFQRYELQFTRRNGSKFIGLISPRPLFDDEGHFKGSFAIITDITERKQAEEQIRKLSAAVEQSPVGVVITDKDGTIEYANPRFQDLTGYAATELVGKNPRLIQGGQTPRDTYERLWKTIRNGDEWRGELHDKRKNGDPYWAHNTIFSIKDESGAIKHFVSLHEDVTARKQAEQRLVESEAKYSLLVENSLTGIYIVQDGRIAYANRQFATKLGYSRNELLGTEVFALIHQEDRDQYADLVANTLVGEGGLESHVVRGMTQGGEVITFKKSFAPILYRGQPAILGNAVDITQEKRLEQQLSNAASQLQVLSEKLLVTLEGERKRVASDLHDGVGQYLHALKFGLQRSTELNCYVTESEKGGTPGCATLVNLAQEAIEEVRRISADLRPPILDDLGIVATIHWFCRRFGAIYSGIVIDSQLDVEESQIPEPMKIGIFRVIQEAMNNAAKYSEASLLQVRLRQIGSTLELMVSDDGNGFEVGEVLGKERHEGGFGLISMRERVKLSGGSFAVDSSPGKGTKIRACWPLRQGDAIQEPLGPATEC